MSEETKDLEEVKKEESVDTNEGVVISETIDTADVNGINISEEVVATIATLAASEVKGVVSMNASGFGDIFRGKNKGVKVSIGEKETVIDINITVEYGSRIPDVCWEVQNNVRTQVENQTGLTVSTVNINVQGVAVSKKGTVKQETPEATEDSTHE